MNKGKQFIFSIIAAALICMAIQVISFGLNSSAAPAGDQRLKIELSMGGPVIFMER